MRLIYFCVGLRIEETLRIDLSIEHSHGSDLYMNFTRDTENKHFAQEGKPSSSYEKWKWALQGTLLRQIERIFSNCKDNEIHLVADFARRRQFFLGNSYWRAGDLSVSLIGEDVDCRLYGSPSAHTLLTLGIRRFEDLQVVVARQKPWEIRNWKSPWLEVCLGLFVHDSSPDCASFYGPTISPSKGSVSNFCCPLTTTWERILSLCVSEVIMSGTYDDNSFQTGPVIGRISWVSTTFQSKTGKVDGPSISGIRVR